MHRCTSNASAETAAHLQVGSVPGASRQGDVQVTGLRLPGEALGVAVHREREHGRVFRKDGRCAIALRRQQITLGLTLKPSSLKLYDQMWETGEPEICMLWKPKAPATGEESVKGSQLVYICML